MCADLGYLLTATAAPLPAHHPYGILEDVKEERVRLIYEAELAYLRGDFTHVLTCFHRTEGDDAARLRSSIAAVAAAISMGDYPTYRQIEAYLKGCIRAHPDGEIAVLAELVLSDVAVSCIAPNMASPWLKKGDFSLIPAPVRPFALYMRAKYFQCTGEASAMLAVAQTALTLCEPVRGINQTGLYLLLCCAMACHALGQEDATRCYLREAMRIALPHGFITPFSEVLTSLGGLVERGLEREFPDCYDAVLEQWKSTFVNWLTFHNQFTKDNITLILTLREYHIALQIARHIPYAEVARQHHISVGRLGNIIQEIYGKLCITDRDELAKYIL